jgi:hypothetical protein
VENPFKFLDSFHKEDKDRFFGRERETAQLYNAIHASNLVLLYGASGTGKTSLVDCGLANRFHDTDWWPVRVRRGNDLNVSLRAEMLRHVGRSVPDPSSVNVVDALQELYFEHYQPVYLIFDQFEELYILGSKKEQARFHETVAQLLLPGPPCKLLIIVREEYIAALSEFERVVPTLFDNRLRIEKMNEHNLMRVVVGMALAGGIRIDEPGTTVRAIVEQVRDAREGVDLAHLQVYLDRLFHTDLERRGGQDSGPVVFDPQLIERVGRFERVLSDFLDQQMARIEASLAEREGGDPKGVPLEVLFSMVTQDGTKRNLDLQSILASLPPNMRIGEASLQHCLDELVRIKLVRRLSI